MAIPDFSAWGQAAGVPAGIADMNVLSQTNARNALLPGELALQQGQIEAQPTELALKREQIKKIPAEIMNLYASGFAHMADAKTKNAALNEMDDMKKIMQDMSGGDPDYFSKLTPSESMNRLMVGAAKSGLYKPTMDIGKIIEQMMGHDATFQRNKIDLQLANLKQQNAMIDAAGSFLTPTHDQESLVKASEDFMRQYKELPPWVKSDGTIPQWSPEFKQAWQDYGTSLKDKWAKDNREERIDALKDHNRTMEVLSQGRLEIQKLNYDRLLKKDEDNVKAGIKVGMPSRSEKDAILALVKNDYSSLKMSDPVVESFAADVAYDAKKARLLNPNIDPSAAAYTAYQNRKGELDAQRTLYGLGPKSKAVFEPRSLGTKDFPIAGSINEKAADYLPEDQRKANKWYTINGRAMQWVSKDGKMQWALEE